MDMERPYHHGDLRAALVDRALQVVETHGHEAVSLRALAEELGVSRGAPYRHFPERDQLLAEVAARGFARLDALGEQVAAQPLGAPGRLVAAAQRFLDFVDAHPQLFRLMYDSGLTQRADAFPALAAAQKSTYDRIFALYCAAAAARPDVHTSLRAGGVRAGDLRAGMIAFWSAIFGYAKIRQAALLQTYMLDDLSAAEVTGAVISAATGFDPLPGT